MDKPENILLSEINQSEKKIYDSCEVSRAIIKSIETESRNVVPRGQGRKKWRDGV